MDSSFTEVDRLLSTLEGNIENAKLSLKELDETLEKLKVLGRNRAISGPIYTRRGVSVLSHYGFDCDPSSASREALRCLANALLLDEPSRQTFVDLNYSPKAALRLEERNEDDEFLCSRILFLLTYNTKLDFTPLVERHRLAQSINRHIAWHAEALAGSSRQTAMQQMAMAEALKLIFNITHHFQTLKAHFTPSVLPLVQILVHLPVTSPPLQPPLTHVLNALMNLDLDSLHILKTACGEDSPDGPTPRPDSDGLVQKLVSILDATARSQPERDLDQAAMPLCTLLRLLLETASPETKSVMREKLLPSDKDRNLPLGQGDSLSARLLRMSASPSLPTLSQNIAALLFDLSDKNATEFIKNVGYGYASGFLMNQNISIPPNSIQNQSEVSAEDEHRVTPVNPITGQKLSAEDLGESRAEGMTEEEKEREAERLFVLFERLRATGVVDVKNPVQQAIDEGRFEELP